MLRCFILLLFLLIIKTLIGQVKGDYNWQLGMDSHPQTDPYPLSLEMTFNDDKLIIDTLYRAMPFSFFNTSISNENGELLLYSNGCQIRDGDHNYVNGSNNLSPGNIDLNWCIQNKVGYPIREGGLFLSFNNDSTILLLHQRETIAANPLTVYSDALFYSKLIKQDSSYHLEEKTVPILMDSLTEGNLEAIQTVDTSSWWILQGKRNSNVYFTIRIESALVDTIFSQEIGDTTKKKGEAAGQAVFAPDGTKYARYSPADDLFLFDFDRSTGILSNYNKIHVADSGLIGGLAFSPNSRFLYVCAAVDLYQFDTWAKNIEESKIHIGHYDGFLAPYPTTFNDMQLGPDCKIYIRPANSSTILHVIHDPNNKGLNCNFEQHGIEFPVSNSISIPNFPVLRTNESNSCDSNIISNATDLISKGIPINIYPNPAIDQIYIELQKEPFPLGEVTISIFDLMGKNYYMGNIDASTKKHSIETDWFPEGIYFIFCRIEKELFIKKVVKIN